LTNSDGIVTTEHVRPDTTPLKYTPPIDMSAFDGAICTCSSHHRLEAPYVLKRIEFCAATVVSGGIKPRKRPDTWAMRQTS